MSDNETFRCKKLSNEITVRRCIRNQREALEFFGPDAARYQSCPCDQGIKLMATANKLNSAPVGQDPDQAGLGPAWAGNINTDAESGAIAVGISAEIQPEVEGDSKMPKEKKICINCGRVMVIMQAHMCGGCCGRIKGKPTEEREAILAQARIDFNTPEYKINKKGRKPASNKANNKTILPSIKHDKDHSLSPAYDHDVLAIMIPITSVEDKATFSFIEEKARRNRRTIPQQLLWMIEQDKEFYDRIQACCGQVLAGEGVQHA